MKSVCKPILLGCLMIGASLGPALAFGQNVNLTIRGVSYSPGGAVKCVGAADQGLTCSESDKGVFDTLTATVPTADKYIFAVTAQGGSYSGVLIDGSCGNYLKGFITYNNGIPTLNVVIPASSVVNNAYSLNYKFIPYASGGWIFQCQPT